MDYPRIAFMVNEWETSGGTRNIAEMGNRLYERGYPVMALVAGDSKDYETNFFNTDSMGKVHIFKPDIIIATFYATTMWALELNQTIKPKLLGYMVQHDESITYGDHVNITYKFGWDFCLTISPWLQRFLQAHGQENIGLFTPALDHDIFKPYNNKIPQSVCFYSRDMERKRPEIGLMALRIIKKQMPHVEIHTYDLYDKPKVDFKVIHHKHPKGEEMAKILSSCQIQIQSTPIEGFGTMSLEPMACGTAVVTPDREGTEQFPDGTILYADVDAEDIADKAMHLLTQNNDRSERVKRGLEFAKTITWEHMTDQVEEFIQKQWSK